MLFIKNSMLQIVIYKKLNFWEEYTPLLLPLPTFNWQIFSHHCATLCLTNLLSSADSWTPLLWLHLQNICSRGFQVLVRRKYNLRGPGLKVCFRYFRDLFGIPPDDFMVRWDLIFVGKKAFHFFAKKTATHNQFWPSQRIYLLPSFRFQFATRIWGS